MKRANANLKELLLFPVIVAVILGYLTLSSDAFRQQSVAVKGVLICGGKRAANIHVKVPIRIFKWKINLCGEIH